MLGTNDVVATIAVKDLARAKRFYEGTLGLEKVASEGDEVVTYKSGSARLNVYQSKFAGTNKATAVTWAVGAELDSLVKELKRKGVEFEHYKDMPDVKLEGDVHIAGEMKVAWFKDPDGNILNIVNQ